MLFYFTLFILIALFIFVFSLFSVPSHTKEKYYLVFFKKLLSLKFLLPKDYREAMAGDLIEINMKLKEEKHSRAWRILIIAGHLFGLVWHTLRFKLGEWFSLSKKPKPPKMN